MRNGLKILMMLAVAAGIALASDGLLANCQDAGRTYLISQCANNAWFGPPIALVDGVPPGVVSAQSWQLGFGNANALQSATLTAHDGSAFIQLPLPGVFIGNDNGRQVADPTAAESMDLRDAPSFPGMVGAPLAGSRCFGFAFNPTNPGWDGCLDDNRTATGAAGGTAAQGIDASDSYVNKYTDYSCGVSPYVCDGLVNEAADYEPQLDAPIAVLLKEGNNKQFALAMLASRNRNKNLSDLDEGRYEFGDINTGVDAHIPATGRMNVVPWQAIPKPNVSVLLDPNQDPALQPRMLMVSWTPIALHHDSSTRPNPNAVANGALGTATGVGVLDQGPLAHYRLESRPLLDSGLCDTAASFTTIATRDHPTASITPNPTVSPKTCVRLTTLFGRTPTGVFLTAATTANRNANRITTELGLMGDVGYSVSSDEVKIGGGSPLVADKAILTVASKNKNAILVGWETTSENSVTGFQIVGVDAKGGRKTVGSADCKQCTTGLGASYQQIVEVNKLQGSKKMVIVSQPSGKESNPLDIQ
jgi:hypothetical protein